MPTLYTISILIPEPQLQLHSTVQKVHVQLQWPELNRQTYAFFFPDDS